jgi:sterol desaturase/sphingolipid hydroxylase (fatty acid hydroxylase superfamily)
LRIWPWPIHKLHHTEKDFNALTSILFHPVDVLAALGFGGVAVELVVGSSNPFSGGATAKAAELALLSSVAVGNYFHHLNCRLPLGVLSPFINGPQAHRIHHSVHERHQGKNFAAFFPYIDWIFGTYHHPRKGEWPDVGIPGELPVRTLLDALCLPFRVWKSGQPRALGEKPIPHLNQ